MHDALPKDVSAVQGFGVFPAQLHCPELPGIAARPLALDSAPLASLE